MNKRMIRLFKGVSMRLLLGALATFLTGIIIWANWYYNTQLDVLYLFGEYILYSPIFLAIVAITEESIESYCKKFKKRKRRELA